MITAAKDCPAPGIYPGVEFETYLSWRAASNSFLGILNISPLHARAFLDGKLTIDETKAMFKGTFTHTGVLEPEEVASRYVVLPDIESHCMTKNGDIPSNPKATKQYKEMYQAFANANSDKKIVSQEMFNELTGAVAAVAAHEVAGPWLRTGGLVEVAIVWVDPVTGLLCKGRIDYLDVPNLREVDLKTTRDGKRFDRAIQALGYDRQGAFYREGLRVLTQKTFTPCIVAVETSVPWPVRAAPLGFTALANGQREYRRLLDLYAECERTGNWPGYESPESWETDLGLGGNINSQSMVGWFNEGAELLGVASDGDKYEESN